MHPAAKRLFAPLEISPFCIILSIVEFLTGFADTAILVMLLIAGRGWVESRLGAWHGQLGRVFTGWKPMPQARLPP